MNSSDFPMHDAEALAEAPGRVNLLGEHTDYNDGFVLPTAIPQRTWVALRPVGGERSTLYAADLDEAAEFTLDAPPQEQFAPYVYGCLHQLHRQTVQQCAQQRVLMQPKLTLRKH